MAKDIFPDPETAPDSRTAYLWKLRRECRGIVFGADGKVIARRFHKFFNVNETDETLSSKINLNRPFVITEKLDGTMISPYFTASKLRYATKAGVTDNTYLVEDYISRSNIPYNEFCTEWIERSFTPIFEYCGPKQPIVLSYAEESLRLITLRHMVTGQYIPFMSLKTITSSAGIPIVNAWEPSELGVDVNHLSSFTLFEAKMKQAKNIEGFVLRFNDGDMLKIKTNWYFTLNKSLDKIRNCSERHLWISILKEEYDDIKVFLPANLRSEMDAFSIQLNTRIHQATENLLKKVSEQYDKPKKEFSIWVQKLQPHEKRIVWVIREILEKNGGSIQEDIAFQVRKVLIDFILNNLNNTKNWKATGVPLLDNLRFREK